MKESSVLIRGVVGSTAYGMAHSESDIDRLGVYRCHSDEILGLTKPTESIVQNNPDLTYHEVGKFFNLCLKGNPTVLELFFLPEYEINLLQYLWPDIWAGREAFLSQRIRKTYGGYVKQQCERLLRRGDFSSDLKKRQNKHGRHCARLLIQGTAALKNHEIKIRLDDAEIAFVRLMGDRAETNQVLFAEIIDDMLAEFDATESTLPMEPNWDFANEWLKEIRIDRMFWDGVKIND